MTPNIVSTADGSITCTDAYSGELYHNRIGAYTEALIHYVQVCDLFTRLSTQPNIAIMDVCFGLGYNSFVLIDALLQYIEQADSIQLPISCSIVGIDQDSKILDLIPQVLLDTRFRRLNDVLGLNPVRAKEMVSHWQTDGKYQFHLKNKVELYISFEMQTADVRKAVPVMVSSQRRFDYIFHDGFSPRVMPELWTKDLFAHYAKLIVDTGRIITYSSAYAVRGAFLQSGLAIRKSASLGGKSGGTVAFKKNQSEIANGQSILFLSNEESERLKGNSGTPYRDPNFNSTSKEIIRRRNLEITQKSANMTT